MIKQQLTKVCSQRVSHKTVCFLPPCWGGIVELLLKAHLTSSFGICPLSLLPTTSPDLLIICVISSTKQDSPSPYSNKESQSLLMPRRKMEKARKGSHWAWPKTQQCSRSSLCKGNLGKKQKSWGRIDEGGAEYGVARRQRKKNSKENEGSLTAGRGQVENLFVFFFFNLPGRDGFGAGRRPCCTEASHIYLQISLTYFFYYPAETEQTPYACAKTPYICTLWTMFTTYVSLAMSLTT